MNHPVRWAVGAVAVVVAIAAAVHFWPRTVKQPPRAPPPAPVVLAPKPGPETPPPIQFPLPPAVGAPSLPALEVSDSSLRETLSALFGRSAFEAMFSQQNIVRRIVATVDNLPREKISQRLLPVNPASGAFLLSGEGETRAIAEHNAARYLPYVTLAESVDTGKLVAAYVRNYPLFQQAYRELGYPSGYFNDRLIQVIDHLVGAPEIQPPVRVVQRKVLYEFADPEHEARSAGQRVMMRIGAGNAARVKTTLRAIRRELTGAIAKP